MPAELFALVLAVAIDGDTLELAGQRWRLAGIDAPELSEPGGYVAKQVLATLVKDRTVVCTQRNDERSHGRMVGHCVVEGLDLGETMIRLGQACRWRRFDREGRYTNLGCER